MVQPWVSMLKHQGQSRLLIIDGLGGSAPRKAAPYDQTKRGGGSVKPGPGFHSKLHLGLQPLPGECREFLSIVRFPQPPLLQDSAVLCQSQTPSWAWDELIINLSATVLRHEYGACSEFRTGKWTWDGPDSPVMQSVWCFSVFIMWPMSGWQMSWECCTPDWKTSARKCLVVDLHCTSPHTLCVCEVYNDNFPI